MGKYNIYVQLTDGAWVGRGKYYSDCFTPVPQADLIEKDFLTGWTPVTDDHAEVLNAMEAGNDVMFLPEPITNA